jgi:TPR repeat protein
MRRGCDGGDPGSCKNLGEIYRAGVPTAGVTADMPKSVPLLRRACEGDVSYCGSLAESYRSAWGVPQDASRAVDLFKKACDSHNVNALRGCAELGEMYERGEAGSPDISSAREYYKLACDNKVDTACQALERLDRGGN